MKKYLENWQIVLLVSLVLVNALVWLAVASLRPKDFVGVSFLGVGQGDAIFITASNGNQVLVDGGRDKTVLRRLAKEMLFFDRSIDVVIETHPDADHIGGLPDVVSRYKVGVFLEPGVASDNSVDDELQRRISSKKIPNFLARRDLVVNLGDKSYLQVLFPDRDVSGLDTNDASIVARYVFGNTCFLLTGDSPIKIEDYLVSTYGGNLKCDVLKAGHHGSRTSTGENYLSVVRPEVAIISAGKDNSYGHPHEEVLESLRQKNIKVLSTINGGSIRLVSNGQKISQR